jgi:serine/threonine protein kinase
MAKIIAPNYYLGPVNAGEERLFKFLEVNLPDDYYIIPNVEFPFTDPRNQQVKYLEYDCIVVAPHAIYNIENKDFSGHLEGDDNIWYLNDKERKNPLITLRFKTSVLASTLKAHNTEWGKAWIQSLVTLSNPMQKRDGLWGQCIRATFLLDDALIKHITLSSSVNRETDAISDIAGNIASFISGSLSVKNSFERTEIEGYEIVEILEQSKNYTEYLVKPKGITTTIRKRVKEYSLDLTGLSPEQRTQRELRIKNQYNALNKIKSNPFILNVQFKVDDENQRFYEITDFLDENSLRSELRKKTFTVEEKINLIFNILTALKAAHEVNIFHRDICPENIFITGGYACLGNFGKSYFVDHEDLGYTVAESVTEQNATPYNALELTVKDAFRSTDIYSIGILIYELFIGKPPVENPFELNRIGGKLPPAKMPLTLFPSLPPWLDELCNHTILSDYTRRWDSIEEIESFLKNAINTEPSKASTTSFTDSPYAYNLSPGSRLGVYTIYREIGSGGYSQVFLVKHNLMGHEYALKLFHESVNANVVMDEYKALCKLNHPNIVKFVFNDILPQTGQFYTLMEYLDGENLKKYSKGDLKLPLHRVYQVAKDILSGLAEMQNQDIPLFHRDIKPQNIVWDKQQRFVLIDFNVSATIENNDFVGTNPYLAPDLIRSGNHIDWDSSADPFALGITLYEIACQNYPWPGRMPLSNTDPVDPQVYNANISDEFAAFLIKSISTKQELRFGSAHEMLRALLEMDVENIVKPTENLIVSSELPPSELSIVEYINSLYSQSKFGNAGTRASLNPSYFDQLTYSQTKLDKKLLPAILDGMYRLVIITGNAGDGKTAFIKQIEKKAENVVRQTSNNGASFAIKGTTFLSNYDGSQDEEEKANNEVLTSFFCPFENLSDFNLATEGRIIAINEGRLADFLQSSFEHSSLANIIDEYFYNEGHTELPPGLMLINLNLRSVVAAEEDEDSIFRNQVKLLTKRELWTKCLDCNLIGRCFIKYNVATLNDQSAGNEVISRFEWLLRTVIYKRELHITVRDIRSFIAFMLTRDCSCEEIPDLIEKFNENPALGWEYYYFNVTSPLAPTGLSNDRLLKLLRETDIAEVSVPAIDRDLFFTIHKPEGYLEFNDRSYDLLQQFNDNKTSLRAFELTSVTRSQLKNIQYSFIRHQFFEGKADFLKRLPYHSLVQFRNLLDNIDELKDEAALKKTKSSIAMAISISEGCTNNTYSSEYLILSTSRVNDPYGKSYRQFNLDDFELFVKKTEYLVRFLEYEPDSMVFRDKNERHIQLSLTLDLFEMLFFIQHGFSPSLNDLKGKYIELQIFKNLLENKEYNEVIVTRDDQEFYRIVQHTIDNKLELVSFEFN